MISITCLWLMVMQGASIVCVNRCRNDVNTVPRSLCTASQTERHSCKMEFSRVFFPTPKYLSVARAKRLCWRHMWPPEKIRPTEQDTIITPQIFPKCCLTRKSFFTVFVYDIFLLEKVLFLWKLVSAGKKQQCLKKSKLWLSKVQIIR